MKYAAIALTFAAGAACADGITLIDAGALDWRATPEGVAFAALEGDRFAEAYHAMVRLPSGTTSPAHVKTAAMIGIVLQGRMLHYAADAEADETAEIGPGGYYRIPGGLAHISSCISAKPCVTYLYQDAAFDFLPVTR